MSTWGSRLRRSRSRPPAGTIVASVVLHALAVGALVLSASVLQPDLPEFRQFRVTLISPPPAVLAPEPEPVETTTPVVAEPEPEPPPTAEKQTPTPPKTQSPDPKPVERTPDPEPAKGPDPKPVEISGEDLDVDLKGEEFPYPEYLENIVRQLSRYFRPPQTNLKATVVFYIRRDGSVEGLDVVNRSGNFQFDLQALRAVESAARNDAFGPLPEGLEGARLPVLFTFLPPKS